MTSGRFGAVALPSFLPFFWGGGRNSSQPTPAGLRGSLADLSVRPSVCLSEPTRAQAAPPFRFFLNRPHLHTAFSFIKKKKTTRPSWEPTGHCCRRHWGLRAARGPRVGWWVVGGGFRAAALECVCLHAPVGPGRTLFEPGSRWRLGVAPRRLVQRGESACRALCVLCVCVHTRTCSCACVRACTGQRGGKQCCRRCAWGAPESTPHSLPWNRCLLPSPGLRYCLLPPSYLLGSQIRFGTFPPLARGATKIAGVPGDWVSEAVGLASGPSVHAQCTVAAPPPLCFRDPSVFTTSHRALSFSFFFIL